MTLDQLEFCTYCIGNVAEALGVSQQKMYNTLLNSGLLYGYIVKFSHILHTYSREYIVEDIVSLLKERNFA